MYLRFVHLYINFISKEKYCQQVRNIQFCENVQSLSYSLMALSSCPMVLDGYSRVTNLEFQCTLIGTLCMHLLHCSGIFSFLQWAVKSWRQEIPAFWHMAGNVPNKYLIGNKYASALVPTSMCNRNVSLFIKIISSVSFL